VKVYKDLPRHFDPALRENNPAKEMKEFRAWVVLPEMAG
jgi:hypothetical protein